MLVDKVNEGVCVSGRTKIPVLVVKGRYLCWWTKLMKVSVLVSDEGTCTGGDTHTHTHTEIKVSALAVI